MEINFKDCTQENLENAYSEYVEKVKENKEHEICTNVLCIIKYKKPKINNGRPNEYIPFEYKFMSTTLRIFWCDMEEIQHVLFVFGNVPMNSVIKFAKVEDVEW